MMLQLHLHLQCMRFEPTLFINTYAALIAARLPDLVMLLLVTRMVVRRMRRSRGSHQLLLLLLDVVRMGMHACQVVVDH